MKAIFLQTADPVRYAAMLNLTAPTVIEYCRRHGFSYENYLGIKRGVWPWQATYNRIIQLQELVSRGYDGWAIYMDADAYIVDLDFDLRAYLADKEEYGAVLTPSMSTDERWDVNIGVCLVNLGHPIGRDLVSEWNARFGRLSEDRLGEAEVWLEYDNDQDMMQQILIERSDWLDHIFMQDTGLINSSHASFIRQYLRGYSTTFEERMEAIAVDVRFAMGDTAPLLAAEILPAEKTRNEAVAALYQALLGRLPDPEGNENAVRCLVGDFGEGLQSLVINILASEEFRSRYRW